MKVTYRREMQDRTRAKMTLEIDGELVTAQFFDVLRYNRVEFYHHKLYRVLLSPVAASAGSLLVIRLSTETDSRGWPVDDEVTVII